jgi:hypothetical protein
MTLGRVSNGVKASAEDVASAGSTDGMPAGRRCPVATGSPCP